MIGCSVTVIETLELGTIVTKEPGHPEGKIWGVYTEESNEVNFYSDNDLKKYNAKQTTNHNQRAN